MDNLLFKSGNNGQVNVDQAQGIVECFVAGIGNKDSVGDIVISGAFAKSLTHRKPRVVWGHSWNDPIGKVLEMYEVPVGDSRLPAKMRNAGIGGLYAKVQFNLQSEKGKEAFATVAFFGEDQEWSIGYKTIDSVFDQNLQANILKEVELYEVSPVLHGANQLTGTISIKADEKAHMPIIPMQSESMPMIPLANEMPRIVVVATPEKYTDDSSASNPFAEGMSRELSQPDKNILQAELSERTGSKIEVINATENIVVFRRTTSDGKASMYRLPYHNEGGQFMFGKPEPYEADAPKPQPMQNIEQKPGVPVVVPNGGIAYRNDDQQEMMNLFDSTVQSPFGKSEISHLIELPESYMASAKDFVNPVLRHHKLVGRPSAKGIIIDGALTANALDALQNAVKALGATLGQVSGNIGQAIGKIRDLAQTFNPYAIDGDGDGFVQDGSAFQRPYIPIKKPGFDLPDVRGRKRNGDALLDKPRSVSLPKDRNKWTPEQRKEALLGGLIEPETREDLAFLANNRPTNDGLAKYWDMSDADLTKEGNKLINARKQSSGAEKQRIDEELLKVSHEFQRRASYAETFGQDFVPPAKREAPKPDLVPSAPRARTPLTDEGLASRGRAYKEKFDSLIESSESYGPNPKWEELDDDDQTEFIKELDYDYMYAVHGNLGDDGIVEAMESGKYDDAIREFAEDAWNTLAEEKELELNRERRETEKEETEDPRSIADAEEAARIERDELEEERTERFRPTMAELAMEAEADDEIDSAIEKYVGELPFDDDEDSFASRGGRELVVPDKYRDYGFTKDDLLDELEDNDVDPDEAERIADYWVESDGIWDKYLEDAISDYEGNIRKALPAAAQEAYNDYLSASADSLEDRRLDGFASQGEPFGFASRDDDGEVKQDKLNELVEGVRTSLLAELETADPATWKPSWRNDTLPINPTTGKPYRGFNAFWLMMRTKSSDYKTGRYAGFNQLKARGAQVRKGEKGVPILRPQLVKKEDEDGNVKEFVVFRGTTVFNIDQADGGDEALRAIPADLPEEQRIKILEDTISELGVNVVTDNMSGPHFSPTGDYVSMPDFSKGVGALEWNSSLAHETIHWTGGASRLNRPSVANYSNDSKTRAYEELVAEIGSAMFLAAHGIDAPFREDHAPYIKGWISLLKDDPDALSRAFKDATAAINHILEKSPNLRKLFGGSDGGKKAPEVDAPDLVGAAVNSSEGFASLHRVRTPRSKALGGILYDDSSRELMVGFLKGKPWEDASSRDRDIYIDRAEAILTDGNRSASASQINDYAEELYNDARDIGWYVYSDVDMTEVEELAIVKSKGKHINALKKIKKARKATDEDQFNFFGRDEHITDVSSSKVNDGFASRGGSSNMIVERDPQTGYITISAMVTGDRGASEENRGTRRMKVIVAGGSIAEAKRNFRNRMKEDKVSFAGESDGFASRGPAEPNEGLRRHKLMPVDIRERMPELYSTEDVDIEDKILAVKFFSPYSNWTWYGVEFDGEDTFFGYVEGFENEWGNFSLSELASARVNGMVPAVERDMSFRPIKFEDLNGEGMPTITEDGFASSGSKRLGIEPNYADPTWIDKTQQRILKQNTDWGSLSYDDQIDWANSFLQEFIEENEMGHNLEDLMNGRRLNTRPDIGLMNYAENAYARMSDAHSRRRAQFGEKAQGAEDGFASVGSRTRRLGMQPSTAVDYVSYDPDSGNLFVAYKREDGRGDMYVYEDVSMDDAIALENAPSAGKAINDIKRRKNVRKATADEVVGLSKPLTGEKPPRSKEIINAINDVYANPEHSASRDVTLEINADRISVDDDGVATWTSNDDTTQYSLGVSDLGKYEVRVAKLDKGDRETPDFYETTSVQKFDNRIDAIAALIQAAKDKIADDDEESRLDRELDAAKRELDMAGDVPGVESIDVTYSTALTAVDYNPSTQEMRVSYKDGGTYIYEGVDKDELDAFKTAPSKGRAMSDIKRAHPYRRDSEWSGVTDTDGDIEEFDVSGSEAVEQVSYDPEKEDLMVIYAGGKGYVYSGVTREEADAVRSASSKGRAINDVKRTHDVRRLTGEDVRFFGSKKMGELTPSEIQDDEEYSRDELRSFIDEQEGLLEAMRLNGESAEKLAQQKKIIDNAKQDLLASDPAPVATPKMPTRKPPRGGKRVRNRNVAIVMEQGTLDEIMEAESKNITVDALRDAAGSVNGKYTKGPRKGKNRGPDTITVRDAETGELLHANEILLTSSVMRGSPSAANRKRGYIRARSYAGRQGHNIMSDEGPSLRGEGKGMTDYDKRVYGLGSDEKNREVGLASRGMGEPPIDPPEPELSDGFIEEFLRDDLSMGELELEKLEKYNYSQRNSLSESEIQDLYERYLSEDSDVRDIAVDEILDRFYSELVDDNFDRMVSANNYEPDEPDYFDDDGFASRSSLDRLLTDPTPQEEVESFQRYLDSEYGEYFMDYTQMDDEELKKTLMQRYRMSRSEANATAKQIRKDEDTLDDLYMAADDTGFASMGQELQDLQSKIQRNLINPGARNGKRNKPIDPDVAANLANPESDAGTLVYPSTNEGDYIRVSYNYDKRNYLVESIQTTRGFNRDEPPEESVMESSEADTSFEAGSLVFEFAQNYVDVLSSYENDDSRAATDADGFASRSSGTDWGPLAGEVAPARPLRIETEWSNFEDLDPEEQDQIIRDGIKNIDRVAQPDIDLEAERDFIIEEYDREARAARSDAAESLLKEIYELWDQDADADNIFQKNGNLAYAEELVKNGDYVEDYELAEARNIVDQVRERWEERKKNSVDDELSDIDDEDSDGFASRMSNDGERLMKRGNRDFLSDEFSPREYRQAMSGLDKVRNNTGSPITSEENAAIRKLADLYRARPKTTRNERDAINDVINNVNSYRSRRSGNEGFASRGISDGDGFASYFRDRDPNPPSYYDDEPLTSYKGGPGNDSEADILTSFVVERINDDDALLEGWLREAIVKDHLPKAKPDSEEFKILKDIVDGKGIDDENYIKLPESLLDDIDEFFIANEEYQDYLKEYYRDDGFASRASINESSTGQRIVPSRMHSDDREALAEITDPEERKKRIDSLIEFYGSRIFAKPYKPKPKRKPSDYDEEGFLIEDDGFASQYKRSAAVKGSKKPSVDQVAIALGKLGGQFFDSESGIPGNYRDDAKNFLALWDTLTPQQREEALSNADIVEDIWDVDEFTNALIKAWDENARSNPEFSDIAEQMLSDQMFSDGFASRGGRKSTEEYKNLVDSLPNPTDRANKNRYMESNGARNVVEDRYALIHARRRIAKEMAEANGVEWKDGVDIFDVTNGDDDDLEILMDLDSRIEELNNYVTANDKEYRRVRNMEQLVLQKDSELSEIKDDIDRTLEEYDSSKADISENAELMASDYGVTPESIVKELQNRLKRHLQDMIDHEDEMEYRDLAARSPEDIAKAKTLIDNGTPEDLQDAAETMQEIISKQKRYYDNRYKDYEYEGDDLLDSGYRSVPFFDEKSDLNLDGEDDWDYSQEIDEEDGRLNVIADELYGPEPKDKETVDEYMNEDGFASTGKPPSKTAQLKKLRADRSMASAMRSDAYDQMRTIDRSTPEGRERYKEVEALYDEANAEFNRLYALEQELTKKKVTSDSEGFASLSENRDTTNLWAGRRDGLKQFKKAKSDILRMSPEELAKMGVSLDKMTDPDLRSYENRGLLNNLARKLVRQREEERDAKLAEGMTKAEIESNFARLGSEEQNKYFQRALANNSESGMTADALLEEAKKLAMDDREMARLERQAIGMGASSPPREIDVSSSSALNYVAYDATNRSLDVEYRGRDGKGTGTLYTYTNVEPEIVDRIENSDSRGATMRQVRDNYEFTTRKRLPDSAYEGLASKGTSKSGRDLTVINGNKTAKPIVFSNGFPKEEMFDANEWLRDSFDVGMDEDEMFYGDAVGKDPNKIYKYDIDYDGDPVDDNVVVEVTPEEMAERVNNAIENYVFVNGPDEDEPYNISYDSKNEEYVIETLRQLRQRMRNMGYGDIVPDEDDDDGFTSRGSKRPKSRWSAADRQRFADGNILRSRKRPAKRRQGPTADEFDGFASTTAERDLLNDDFNELDVDVPYSSTPFEGGEHGPGKDFSLKVMWDNYKKLSKRRGRGNSSNDRWLSPDLSIEEAAKFFGVDNTTAAKILQARNLDSRSDSPELFIDDPYLAVRLNDKLGPEDRGSLFGFDPLGYYDDDGNELDVSDISDLDASIERERARRTARIAARQGRKTGKSNLISGGATIKDLEDALKQVDPKIKLTDDDGAPLSPGAMQKAIRSLELEIPWSAETYRKIQREGGALSPNMIQYLVNRGILDSKFAEEDDLTIGQALQWPGFGQFSGSQMIDALSKTLGLSREEIAKSKRTIDQSLTYARQKRREVINKANIRKASLKLTKEKIAELIENLGLSVEDFEKWRSAPIRKKQQC